MPEPLVLHVEAFWSSPWVCSVHFAMREKQLPFATSMAMMRHGTGLLDEMHERALTGSAPVLQHGAFWLAESLPIVEYLEEVFPLPHVLPVDVRDRARARQILTWMRTEHAALYRERPSERIFYPSTSPLPPLSPPAQRAADDLLRVAGRLCTGARPVFGDRFGVLDVELAFALMRLVATGSPVPDPLSAYAAAVWTEPSVREFVEHRRPPNPPW